MNGKTYTSGIGATVEVMFGGDILIRVVSSKDYSGVHGITLSRREQQGKQACQHSPEITLLFNNTKSVETLQRLLQTVSDQLKLDTERRRANIDDVLATKIVECDLSARTMNVCRAQCIETIGDLARLQLTDILKCRNAGHKTVHQLGELLKENGLHWGMEFCTSDNNKDNSL